MSVARYWLQELFVRHRAELRCFLQRRGAGSAVDDLLQESFIRLLDYPREGLANPRALLYRVAANLSIDYARKRRRHEAALQREELALRTDERTPEQSVAALQQLDHLWQTMQGLPAKCLEVFVMRTVDGLNHRQIAERLQISERMVSKHLQRAMNHCLNNRIDD